MATGRRPALGKSICLHCGQSFGVRGLFNHEKACRNREELEEPNPVVDPDSVDPEPNEESTRCDLVPTTEIVEIVEDPRTEEAQGSEESIEAGRSGQTPKDGDIVVEYHPNSEKDPRTLSPDEFKDSFTHQPGPTGPLDDEPWCPFSSKEDFEFAELVHESKLNQKQIERMIKLIQRCQQAPGSFTLNSYKDLHRALADATKLLTNFEREEVVREFEGDKKTYETWYRPLWGWIVDHLIDPELVQQFEWDAQKVFRFKDGTYTQIFTEPWTGKRFWDSQTSIPKDGKPVCIELYADKSKLSSFGTAKGYPVMARLLNLPVKIRNGGGVGGARVVGWLPVIEDSEEDKSRPGWVNFKQAIWHDSFYQLLKSIEAYSVTGCWVTCGDGIERKIYPIILILAADYEEQSVMALIRGVTSLHPCPRCLIHKDQQGDLSQTAALRTAADMKAKVLEARETEYAYEKEEILKGCGLRDVDNVFWKIKNSDPYGALSFDRLHTFPGGLFHHHLWKYIKLHAELLTREERTQVDDMADSVPRWRGLNHFTKYLAVEFTDGSKWEDMSKICVPVMRNLLGEHIQGRRLLCCTRAYVELDLLASFDVHTDITIKQGRAAAKKFSKLANEYLKGGWNFPKMHLTQHLFDDIEAKGVTRNFTSKTFEKMHGPLGDTYARVTNFKNVGGQILKVEHNDLILEFIRAQIKRFDDFIKGTPDAVEAVTVGESSIIGMGGLGSLGSLGTGGSILLGAGQKVLTIEKFLGDVGENEAFNNFCSRVTHAVQALSPTSADTIAVNDSHQITEYRFIKVKYQSMVDWTIRTDYLRCSPEFSGRPRYDFVILKLSQGCVLAELVFIFVCRVGGQEYRLALVQRLTKSSRGGVKEVDKKLSIYRWEIRPRTRCEVISVDSIVRGAVLVKDPKYKGDYFVIDTLDEDMFLRMKQLR